MGSDFDFAPNNIRPDLPFYLVYTISDRKANGIRSEKSALPAAFFRQNVAARPPQCAVIADERQSGAAAAPLPPGAEQFRNHLLDRRFLDFQIPDAV